MFCFVSAFRRWSWWALRWSRVCRFMRCCSRFSLDYRCWVRYIRIWGLILMMFFLGCCLIFLRYFVLFLLIVNFCFFRYWVFLIGWLVSVCFCLMGCLRVLFVLWFRVSIFVLVLVWFCFVCWCCWCILWFYWWDVGICCI